MVFADKGLSERLRLLLDLTPEGADVADIGCDHAYLAIALSRKNPERRVFAMDLRKGPLERARENIRRSGAADQVETRLSDGFQALSPGETEAAVIAGMGGALMCRILEEGKHLFTDRYTLVLSPQSEPEKVRDFLGENGFAIDREEIIREEGKFYPLIRAIKTELIQASSREEEKKQVFRLYGEKLLQNPDPLVDAYLQKEKDQIKGLLSAFSGREEKGISERRKELQQSLLWVEEAAAYREGEAAEWMTGSA